MKNIILAALAVAVTVVSCKSKKQLEPTSERDIHYTSLSIDTVTVDVALKDTVFALFSGVNDGHIYCLEQNYGVYHYVSTDGKVDSTSLGFGMGEDQIPVRSLRGAASSGDGRFLALGPMRDNYVFETTGERSKFYIKVYHDHRSYEDIGIYTLYYPELNIRMNGDKVYYNIYSQHPVFGYVMDETGYFKNAHILMEVDDKTGEVTRLLGKYPEYYADNYAKVIPYMPVCYDVDSGGNFHVSFQADSLVYVYDNDFNPVKAYGLQGSGMNTDYAPLNMTIFVEQSIEVERKYKSYYYWFKYYEPEDIAFRSYVKNQRSATDGLQIYRNGVLIADVDVPKNFKVAGYVAPYFVTQMVDDEGAVKFYRFKLE